LPNGEGPTNAFERYALTLSSFMTILDAAKYLQVSWGTIKDIQKRYLKRRYRNPSLKYIQRIAIDKISIGKGHRYLTVFLNLRTGAFIFVGDGKGADALLPFFKRLKRSKANVKAVAIDMSPAYIAAVLENLPDTAIVVDRFHAIKMYNDQLSQLRRALFNEASGRLEKQVLKGTLWLLLKNPENLYNDKNEQHRLCANFQCLGAIAAKLRQKRNKTSEIYAIGKFVVIHHWIIFLSPLA
jgi:transposase